jgi:MIP family channel proteins
MFNYKVFVAEFIGTFALVFLGAAAGIYSSITSLGMGVLGVALAHGLTVMVFVYIYGDISGTHINPAVTLGYALNGTVKWIEALVYWVAQFAGAVVAAFLLRTFLTLLSPTLFAGAATTGVLSNTTQYPFYYAMGLEALLTFFLVNAYLHTTVGVKASPFAGLAIGLTLTIAILAGGPLTGASLNPARSFGPAVFTSALDASRPDIQNPMLYLIYFVGPFVGSIVAVLVYKLFQYTPATSDEFDEFDEDEIEVVEVIEEVVIEEPVKKPARKPTARKSATRKTTKK